MSLKERAMARAKNENSVRQPKSANNYYSRNLHRGIDLLSKVEAGTITMRELALLFKLRYMRYMACKHHILSEFTGLEREAKMNDFNYHMSAMVRLKQEHDMAVAPIRASLTTIWNGIWWQLRFALVDTAKELFRGG